jgi:hypothetical protein
MKTVLSAYLIIIIIIIIIIIVSAAYIFLKKGKYIKILFRRCRAWYWVCNGKLLLKYTLLIVVTLTATAVTGCWGNQSV